MSALTSLSADRLVHVCFILRDGRRAWHSGVDRVEDPVTKAWHMQPRIDDDHHASRPMPLEFALVALRRWRALGFNVHLSLDQNGPFLDDEPEAKPAFAHQDFFVVTNEIAKTGYLVRAVCTPEGKMFCLKFSNPLLENQSVLTTLADGPEAPIRKAKEMHFLEIEPPQVSPFKAQRESEARKLAEKEEVQNYGRVRPGCARR